MHPSTLTGWLTWLEQLHPSGIDLGLERVHQVAVRASLLTPSFPVITVGGTNGKGSVCALLESILKHAGYRVGLYTSPHIFHYNERVRIDAQAIDDAALCGAFEQIENSRADTSLTYFEFGTLVAMQCFQQAAVDIAILEVGLGGRLDAVNLWDAEVSIISSLALDHTDWLGDTLDAIAYEKTGIARTGRPLIVGESAPPERLYTRADEIGATLFLRGQHFDYQLPVQSPATTMGEHSWHFVSENSGQKHLPAPGIMGSVRYLNASIAVQAIKCLSESFPVGETALHDGLRAARLPGRAQHIQIDGIDCIFDVAHNPQAIAAFAGYLSQCQPVHHNPGRSPEQFTGKTIAIAAFMADKAIPQMLGLLAGTFDHWYTGDLPLPRAMSGAQLAALLAHHAQANVSVEATVRQAFQRALAEASVGDRLVIFGSFVTVAETLPVHL